MLHFTVLLLLLSPLLFDCNTSQSELNCSNKCPIGTFHMSFGIRIKSPIHVNTLNIPIQNFKYPKNAKNARTDITLLPSGHPFGTWVPISMLRGPKNVLTPAGSIVSMTGVGKEMAKRTTHHTSHWL